MTRQSWYLMLLFLILIFTFSYFALLYLQTRANLFLGIAILWAILLPVLSSFPYSFSYILSLPSPIFGTWILVMILIEKYVNLSIYLMCLGLFSALFLVYIFHALTRGRTMFWKLPMASLARSGVAAISVMLLGLGVIVVNPSAVVLDSTVELFFFSTVLLTYVGSSMLYINFSYRLFVLSNRLNVLHLENDLSTIWKEIEKKHPNQRGDLDLLQYYFSESLRSFLEGDFEKSLIWGYKVIREKTIVDPREYVDDKRPNKPSFGDIRNTLMHSRREEHIEAGKIRQIIKNLFNDCLDLLEREFIFIKKIS